MNISVNPQDLLFALAPVIIAMITRPAWSSGAKFLAALVVCFGAALAQVFFLGQGDLAHLPLACGKAFGICMTIYAGILKPLLPKSLEFLETQINPGPNGPPPPTRNIPAEFPGQDAGGPGVKGS